LDISDVSHPPAHLQIAQANAKPKFAKELFFASAQLKLRIISI
jgi:hypothetical protein